MKSIVIASALLLASATAVAAQPAEEEANAGQAAGQAPSAPAAAVESNPEDEKKVCRTERATGSLTRRTRICMTAAQWREVHDRTRRGVGEMQSQAAGGTNSSFSSQGSGL